MPPPPLRPKLPARPRLGCLDFGAPYRCERAATARAAHLPPLRLPAAHRSARLVRALQARPSRSLSRRPPLTRSKRTARLAAGWRRWLRVPDSFMASPRLTAAPRLRLRLLKGRRRLPACRSPSRQPCCAHRAARAQPLQYGSAPAAVRMAESAPRPAAPAFLRRASTRSLAERLAQTTTRIFGNSSAQCCSSDRRCRRPPWPSRLRPSPRPQCCFSRRPPQPTDRRGRLRSHATDQPASCRSPKTPLLSCLATTGASQRPRPRRLVGLKRQRSLAARRRLLEGPSVQFRQLPPLRTRRPRPRHPRRRLRPLLL